MRRFLRKTDGLVTVEWVGIVCVMVLAALGISSFVMHGTDDAGKSISMGMDTLDPTPNIGAFGSGAN